MNKIKLSCGHSGEEIPVPIPNTEVKLSNADDTALLCGKVGSCKTFLFNIKIRVIRLVFEDTSHTRVQSDGHSEASGSVCAAN